jgi:hypothetical protein
MADRVLFISWGAPVPGREERSIEVFNDALGYYGRLQQEARIERFEVVLFGANAHINGYMQLHGSHEQLDAVLEADEFRDVLAAAALVVSALDVSEGVTNAGIAAEMDRYRAQIARVGEPA